MPKVVKGAPIDESMAGDDQPESTTKRAGSARRTERLQASAPYPAERMGAIASMLENDEDGMAFTMSANDLEERTAAVVGAEEELDGTEDQSNVPSFNALTAAELNGGKVEFRRIAVPPNRFTPLKENWNQIYEPIVKNMKLQIRMNLKTRNVELRTSQYTEQISSLQKGADFVKAFIMGFEIQDAVALLRLDDLYVDTFEIKDVKPLQGDHLSRAIGRIAGKAGKTKFAIENATRTRIVLADSKIHMLGSFSNIKIARDAICDLILGSPPGKVYTKLRTIASRLKERF